MQATLPLPRVGGSLGGPLRSATRPACRTAAALRWWLRWWLRLWLLVPALLAAPWPAAAGPWEATNAQGLTVRITQDSYRTREGYLLERFYPDGTADAGFGQQGHTLFALGPDNEGPAALALDALGRPWVAGASAGSGETLMAVVLRFLPGGAPDLSYAEGGRSTSMPGGRRARALNLAPQADGSAFVVGQVLGSQGQEITGWWRLRPDGRVDPGFGLGGVWVDEGRGSTEVLALTAGADGSLALALRRGQDAAARLEAWVLAPAGTAPVLAAHAPADAGAQLAWRDGRWRWTSAPAAASASTGAPASTAVAAEDTSPRTAPPAPASAIPTASAAAQATPSSTKPAPNPPQGRQWAWAAVALAVLLGLAVLGFWLRRRRTGVHPQE